MSGWNEADDLLLGRRGKGKSYSLSFLRIPYHQCIVEQCVGDIPGHRDKPYYRSPSKPNPAEVEPFIKPVRVLLNAL